MIIARAKGLEFMCKSLSGAGFLFLSAIWDCVCAFCSRAEKEEKVRLAHHREVKGHGLMLIANSNATPNIDMYIL